jgi:superfamily II DNA or RNA helicase
MVNLDLKKDEIQNKAVEEWLKTKKGTIEGSTGFGKTFCFFKALLKSCKIGDTILFLAETRQREIDLFVDLEKFEKIFKVNLKAYNIKFDCYQSAYKWKDLEFDFVCCDEIHDSLSPKYSKFYENNKVKYILGLSATVDRNTSYTDEDNTEFNKGELLDKYCPIVFKYTLNDAITDNLTKKLNIFVIYHQLDSIKKTVKAGTKDNEFLTTEKAAYDYWDKEFKKAIFLPDGNSKVFRIRNTSAARAKVLYKMESKIIAIKELLNELQGKTLIFSNDIDSLEKVTKNVISGRNSDVKNLKIRHDFERNKIKHIGSFKMLKQGANLTNLDNTIISSYYSKELDTIQRLGRQRNSDATGNVFIFLTIGTQEAKWFESSFKNITNYNMIYCNGIQDTIKKYKESI